MSQGMTEEHYKGLLESFSPEKGKVGDIVGTINVSKEKKEQAKKFLMIAEQSLGGGKPKHVKATPDQSQSKQRKLARPVTGRVMRQNKDMKTLLHESIERVASGMPPVEMALFLMEGEDSGSER